MLCHLRSIYSNFLYLLLFALAALLIDRGKGAFLPMSFDAGGVTTGPVTVPSIMALGVGIAQTVGGKRAGENSFGLVALCSVGPVIAVLLLALGAQGELSYPLSDYRMEESLAALRPLIRSTMAEVARSLVLLGIFFFAIQLAVLRLPRQKLLQIVIGLAQTFLGLVIFLIAVSIGLSVLRVLRGFSLLYYLVPGYLLSLGLSFFVPPMYTAIAFDSGGVASGPLTSSFILPFAIGVCSVVQGKSEILELAFGIVSMVAMTPLITIQALGFRAVVSRQVRRRRAIKRILTADDAEIIYFE